MSPQTTKPTPNGVEKPAQVALICMPFAVLYWPALGISLLKSVLAQRGIPSDIHYLTIPFVEQIGWPAYDCIPLLVLYGEWLFARDLFGTVGVKDYPFEGELQRRADNLGLPPEHLELFHQAHGRTDIGAYLDNCMSSIPWEKYQIIGFSVMAQQTVSSLALAKRIKEAWPEGVIVFGGAACEGEMGLELHQRFPFIDYVCRGEGDQLFPALVEGLLAGDAPPELPGLISRLEDGSSHPVGDRAPLVTDLDGLPYPDYDDFFRHLAGSSIDLGEDVWLFYESSRGCWYGEKRQCVFCGLSGEGMVFRKKSAERVLDELSYLSSRYGVKRLAAADLILDLSYLHDLVPMLIERDLGFSIFYEVKANLRKDQLRVLKQAGIDYLQPGIESLSTDILKLMRKGCTALGNVQTLKWAGELDIQLEWNFLMGFPGEEPEEYERLADMVPSLLHLQPPSFWRGGRNVTLYRFSPYFDNPEEWGITNVRLPSVYKLIYPFPEESLWRMAYFFDFDYADGRDPDAYTDPLVEMMHYWQDNYCPGALTCVSVPPKLVIYDRRPSAVKECWELEGAQKAAYEYCDEAHSSVAIHRYLVALGYAVDGESILHLLEEWVEGRLMLREGDWFLSLAVSTDDLADELGGSDVIRQALAMTLAGMIEGNHSEPNEGSELMQS